MNLATETFCVLWSMLLVALCVATSIERHRKRREDEKWCDDLIARHREELSKHYRDGRFRSKNLWNQPR